MEQITVYNNILYIPVTAWNVINGNVKRAEKQSATCHRGYAFISFSSVHNSQGFFSNSFSIMKFSLSLSHSLTTYLNYLFHQCLPLYIRNWCLMKYCTYIAFIHANMHPLCIFIKMSSLLPRKPFGLSCGKLNHL